MVICYMGPDLGLDLEDDTSLSSNTRDGNIRRGGTQVWRPRWVDGNGATTPRQGDKDDDITLTKNKMVDVDI